MGLRSGLPHLGPPRRCVADLAAPIQLAPAAQQSKIKSAHQPPRSCRGQPVEAPHLVVRENSGFRGLGRASPRDPLSGNALDRYVTTSLFSLEPEVHKKLPEGGGWQWAGRRKALKRSWRSSTVWR